MTLYSSRPEMAVSEFVLQTTFPNKILTDMSQSLADAKLLNGVSGGPKVPIIVESCLTPFGVPVIIQIIPDPILLCY